MRLPRKYAVFALGTMLATAGAMYAAPVERSDARGSVRAGEASEHRGQALVREGKRLERIGQVRRGEALERQGRALIRRGESLERQGWRESRDRR